MDTLTLIRWIVCAPFAFVFVLGAVGNWGLLLWFLYQRLKPHDPTRGGTTFVSVIPGLCGLVAMLIAPIPGLWRWCWAALFIDWTFFPMSYHLIGMLMRGEFNHKPPQKQ